VVGNLVGWMLLINWWDRMGSDTYIGRKRERGDGMITRFDSDTQIWDSHRTVLIVYMFPVSYTSGNGVGWVYDNI